MTIRPGEWVVLIGAILIVAFAVVVGTAIYQKPPPVRFVYLESPESTQGEIIFRRQYCFSCHEVFNNGSTYGPTLDGIGSKRTQAWLLDYLRAPRAGVSIKPYRLKMPAYDTLEDAKLNALVAYLQALGEMDANNRLLKPSG